MQICFANHKTGLRVLSLMAYRKGSPYGQELGQLFVPELLSLSGSGWELVPLPASVQGPAKAPWALLHGCGLRSSLANAFSLKTLVLTELFELSWKANPLEWPFWGSGGMWPGN